MSEFSNSVEGKLDLLKSQETYAQGMQELRSDETVTIAELLAGLDTPDQLVQAGIVEVVSSKGDDALAPVLNAMQSESQFVQGNCITILTFIGEAAIEPLVSRIEETPMDEAGVYIQAADRFGEHLLPVLRRKVLEEKSSSDALFALLAKGDPSIITEFEGKIMDLLGSPDQSLVTIATDFLLHDGEAALPILRKMIGQINPYKQQNATNVLIAMGESAVPILVAALGDMSQLVQQNAIRALTEIGEPAAEELSYALDGTSALRQQNAAIVLESIQKKGKKGGLFGRFKR